MLSCCMIERYGEVLLSHRKITTEKQLMYYFSSWFSCLPPGYITQCSNAQDFVLFSVSQEEVILVDLDPHARLKVASAEMCLF